MNTIRAIIIDDEPLAHNVILKYAEDIPYLNIVGQAYLATDAYALVSQQSIDLIFLDIDMPILKGLDFLRTLHQSPHVIVTSAHEKYALEGFELQVTDYLLKPFRFDRFLKAIHLVNADQEARPSITQQYIFIKVDKRQLQVDLTTIQYLESYGNYVKVWIDDQYHLTPRTLSSFATSLDDRFQQIHKSYIVQKSFIKYIEGNKVLMRNGNAVSVGKSYRSVVRDLF